MPLAYDDYVYAFVWNGTDFFNEMATRYRLVSFSDLFLSQWSHYFTWGGRVFAHSFLQFFVWLGKPFFNLANTAAFGLLLYLLNFIATGSRVLRPFNLLFLFFGWWFCTEQLLMSCIWLSGSCNYLWMSLLQLSFLAIFVSSFRGTLEDHSFFVSPLFVPFAALVGLAAGWSNEAGCCACIVMALLFSFALRARGRLELWHFAALFGLLVGAVFLLKAPGNLRRMSMVYPHFHWAFSLDFLRVVWVYLKGPFFTILANEFLLFLPLIYYFFMRWRQRLALGEAVIIGLTVNEVLMLVFAAGALVVPTVMLAAPEFDTHVGFTSTVFLLASSLMAVEELRRRQLLSELWRRHSVLRLLVSLFSAAAVLGMFLCLCSDFSVYSQVQTQLEVIQRRPSDFARLPSSSSLRQSSDTAVAGQQLEATEPRGDEYKIQSAEVVCLPPLRSPGPYDAFFKGKTVFYYMHHLGGITKDAHHFRNVAVAKYYGLNKIIAVDD